MRILRVPGDLQEKIYRTYFSHHVVPFFTNLKTLEYKTGSFGFHALQSALSRANMYTKGRLDVTDLPSEDRLQVFSELSARVFNMQIEMKSGRSWKSGTS